MASNEEILIPTVNSYANDLMQIDSNILMPVMAVIFFIILAIIIYYYRQIITKRNLVEFIVLSFLTILLIYLKGVIVGTSSYEPIIYVVLFMFIYSIIKSSYANL